MGGVKSVELTTVASDTVTTDIHSTTEDIEGGSRTMQMNPLLHILQERPKKHASKTGYKDTNKDTKPVPSRTKIRK